MEEETAVIICGGGPTGALLSALLGKAAVPNVVLEREADITADPRGIVLDEDGIRTLQALGLYAKVFTEIGSGALIERVTDIADVCSYGKIQLCDWSPLRFI